MKGSPIHGYIPDILFEHIWVIVLHATSSSDVTVFMLDQPINGFQSRAGTQNNGKLWLMFCKIMESNFQKLFSLLFCA